MSAAKSRTPIVAGNWKMFTNRARASELARAVVQGVGQETRVRVVLCPPFPYLSVVGEALVGSPLWLGAQNCYPEPEGPFTGEVSPSMLADVGCRMVILGHSERRHGLGETDAFINKKVHAALKAGLVACLCVGETLPEHEAKRTRDVLREQLAGSLARLSAADLTKVVLAYEPVWAIGTGKTASPEQAQSEHAFIRSWVSAHFGEESAAALPIVYGGSMKPKNAADLLGQPDVDGGLIGGASLEADQFLPIVQAAR